MLKQLKMCFFICVFCVAFGLDGRCLGQADSALSREEQEIVNNFLDNLRLSYELLDSYDVSISTELRLTSTSQLIHSLSKSRFAISKDRKRLSCRSETLEFADLRRPDLDEEWMNESGKSIDVLQNSDGIFCRRSGRIVKLDSSIYPMARFAKTARWFNPFLITVLDANSIGTERAEDFREDTFHGLFKKPIAFSKLADGSTEVEFSMGETNGVRIDRRIIFKDGWPVLTQNVLTDASQKKSVLDNIDTKWVEVDGHMVPKVIDIRYSRKSKREIRIVLDWKIGDSVADKTFSTKDLSDWEE